LQQYNEPESKLIHGLAGMAYTFLARTFSRPMHQQLEIMNAVGGMIEMFERRDKESMQSNMNFTPFTPMQNTNEFTPKQVATQQYPSPLIVNGNADIQQIQNINYQPLTSTPNGGYDATEQMYTISKDNGSQWKPSSRAKVLFIILKLYLKINNNYSTADAKQHTRLRDGAICVSSECHQQTAHSTKSNISNKIPTKSRNGGTTIEEEQSTRSIVETKDNTHCRTETQL
jgi:hypothetical protein